MSEDSSCSFGSFSAMRLWIEKSEFKKLSFVPLVAQSSIVLLFLLLNLCFLVRLAPCKHSSLMEKVQTLSVSCQGAVSSC